MSIPVFSWLIVAMAMALCSVGYGIWRRTRQVELGKFAHREGFSIEHYQALLPLLDSKEVTYLTRQPGCTPAIVKAYRQRRRQVCYDYLAALRSDFRVLDRTSHFLLLHTTGDHSTLVVELSHKRTAFRRQLRRLEFAVFMQQWSWGALPAAEALQACDAFRGLVLQLQQSKLQAGLAHS